MNYSASKAVPARSGPGLKSCHFERIAQNGFGDGQNSYAHAMGWFQDHLYVGTTRNVMCGPKPFADRLKSLISVYPVRVPKTSPWDRDYRAQIWRYDPRSGQWQRLHISNTFAGMEGFEFPRQIGFRSMTTFEGKNDQAPALFTAAYSTRMGPGPTILRSENGTDFEEVANLGTIVGAETVRAMNIFKGRLFLALSSRNGSRDIAQSGAWVTILVTDDPTRGPWQAACNPSFGDPKNATFFEMTAFAGYLYAATLNPYDGFQIWKTDAVGKPPYRWRKVIGSGAYRGNLNETVSSMCAYQDCLYVGTAINYAGYDRVFNVGPAAPELLRIYPDDSWDLIIGTPRRTPDGTKVPISGMGPGFNNPLTAYIWQLCEHDGWLYAGTSDKTNLLQFCTSAAWSHRIRETIDAGMIEKIVERFGGFDLWRTRDGDHWFPVTQNGFGNPYNMGVRTLISTPVGLFLGTANPFGPEVAVKRATGWHYELNLNGGLEIFLGKRSPPENPDKNSLRRCSIRLTGAEAKRKKNDGDHFQNAASEYYRGTTYRCCGYWKKGIRDPVTACENLIDELLALLRQPADLHMPFPQTDEEEHRFFKSRAADKSNISHKDKSFQLHGKILDLGCCQGATTGYLLRNFAPDAVAGVTANKADLDICRRNISKVKFHFSRLPDLDFSPESFDYVICIEGMDRGKARKKLLKEIWRVLKPNGRLIFSDFLYEKQASGLRTSFGLRRREFPEDPQKYKDFLLETGFQEVRVIDATTECWKRFHQNSMKYFWLKVIKSEFNEKDLKLFKSNLPGGYFDIKYYLLIRATKPQESGLLR
ncbi:MAG: class I SAM-dependent methyltransferase [Planctomycetota bacterium]|jgi:ubiquinone/menaquinone biosynthesis C-methylase UbiE